MAEPLVSVITPTWARHEQLLTRCIPSVQAQTYRNIQHIVVSDGPDPELRRQLPSLHELPTHHGTWGGPGRRRGCELATGDYIAYLDDDDAYRPEHVAMLAAALDAHPEAGFAHSWMLVRMSDNRRLCYQGPPDVMLGTPMIMHRRELLEIATWGASQDEDTVLVRAWLDAGVDYGEVTMTTVDVYPGPATTAAINSDPRTGVLNWE